MRNVAYVMTYQCPLELMVLDQIGLQNLSQQTEKYHKKHILLLLLLRVTGQTVNEFDLS